MLAQALSYWYVASARRFYQAFLRAFAQLEATFAVRDTARNLGKPLFQDYTWQGRLIGLFLRLARIGLGVLTYGLAGCLYLFLYLLWLAFPLLCLTNVIGGLFGPVPSG